MRQKTSASLLSRRCRPNTHGGSSAAKKPDSRGPCMPHEPAFLCEHVVVSVTATRLPNDPGVGTLVNGGISVISPKGELVDFVPTHEKYATNICFSGTDM